MGTQDPVPILGTLTQPFADRVHENVVGLLRQFMMIAQAMVKHILGDAPDITLPLHPQSNHAKAFTGKATCNAWEAGMIYLLREKPALASYIEDVRTGDRLAGRPLWSPAFDLAD